jgi:hypothetical protein
MVVSGLLAAAVLLVIGGKHSMHRTSVGMQHHAAGVATSATAPAPAALAKQQQGAGEICHMFGVQQLPSVCLAQSLGLQRVGSVMLARCLLGGAPGVVRHPAGSATAGA